MKKRARRSGPLAPRLASRLSPRSRKKSQVFFWNEGKALFGGCPGRTRRIWCVVVFFLRQGEEESTELSTTTSRPKRVKGEREKSLCFFFTLYFFLNFFSLSSGVPLSCLHSRETRVQSEALLCLIYTKLKTEEGIR